MTVQPGLCQAWSETPKTGFLTLHAHIFLETSTGETKEKMKDVESDVLDIQDSEMDKSNIGTDSLCTVS